MQAQKRTHTHEHKKQTMYRHTNTKIHICIDMKTHKYETQNVQICKHKSYERKNTQTHKYINTKNV